MPANTGLSAQKIDQSFATLYSTYGWARMSRGAAAIQFARRLSPRGMMGTSEKAADAKKAEISAPKTDL